MKVELFDRYVQETGRHLPRHLRADVAAELHSLLVDALQDRIAGTDAEHGPDLEALQVAILKEFGPPAKVAERYAPPRRYLIGPQFFGLYWIVVAAVLGGLALSHLVLLGLAVWSQAWSPNGLPSLAAWLGSFLNLAVKGFAAATVTFAVLERVMPASALGNDDEATEWDPRSLPRVQDDTRIEAGSIIVETGLLVIALIVFNLLPNWVGINFPGSVNGQPTRWYSVPLLSPTFRTTYLPWLDALWILSIGLNLALLRRGRWERITRLADFLLAVGGVVLLYALVSGPSILTAEAVQTSSLRELTESILSPIVRVGLIVALIAAGVDAAHKLLRLLRRHPSTVLNRPR